MKKKKKRSRPEVAARRWLKHSWKRAEQHFREGKKKRREWAKENYVKGEEGWAVTNRYPLFVHSGGGREGRKKRDTKRSRQSRIVGKIRKQLHSFALPKKKKRKEITGNDRLNRMRRGKKRPLSLASTGQREKRKKNDTESDSMQKKRKGKRGVCGRTGLIGNGSSGCGG